jgi:hypothetical protein
MGNCQDRLSPRCCPGKDYRDAVRHHNRQRTPGGHHCICGRGGRAGRLIAVADKGYGVAVNLVHVLEAAGRQAGFGLKEFTPAKHFGRIVPHVEGEVSGPGVSECHPDAGPDFGSPPKQSKHR